MRISATGKAGALARLGLRENLFDLRRTFVPVPAPDSPGQTEGVLKSTCSTSGSTQQSVSRLPVGDQLDDTVFATKPGRLLVSDGVTGVTYWIRSNNFLANTTNHYLYTEAPDDSGTVGFVGTIDPGAGLVTPVVIGFTHPTGMIYVSD